MSCITYCSELHPLLLCVIEFPSLCIHIMMCLTEFCLFDAKHCPISPGIAISNLLQKWSWISSMPMQHLNCLLKNFLRSLVEPKSEDCSLPNGWIFFHVITRGSGSAFIWVLSHHLPHILWKPVLFHFHVTVVIDVLTWGYQSPPKSWESHINSGMQLHPSI